MGLLDRFRKNKEKEQLEQLEKKAPDVVVEKSKKEEKNIETKKVEDKKEKKAIKATEDSKAAQKTEVRAGEAYKVLVRPLVSEKSAVQEAKNQYTFVVSKNANKYKVKQAVKEVYGAMPEKVRIINMQGKFTRFGRAYGRRSDWKKAIVSLPKGRSINIHEGV